MVRVEGGAWRGQALKVPSSKELRPSSNKTRAAIFNILESQRMKLGLQRELAGWRCLDLFAGVGALGIEAMSRGADACIFVEANKAHARALSQNVEALDAAARTELLVLPVERSWSALARLAPFDLVFADPPYSYRDFNALYSELMPLTQIGAWLVLEHDPKLTHTETGIWTLSSSRTLGPAGISIFRRLS